MKSFMFSLLIVFSVNVSVFNEALAEVAKPIPRVSGGVWYFLRKPPSPPPAKIATKEEADRYFAPLVEELRKRNPANDAREAYARGDRFLLGVPVPDKRFPSNTRPDVVAQAMRSIGI